MIIKALKKASIEFVVKPMMPIGAWYFRISPRMITCRQFNDFIFDYTEELLTKEQVKLFERHMKFCPSCRNFMKAYVATFKSGKAFFPYSDEVVPHTVPDDLLNAIIAVDDVEQKRP